MSIPAWLNTDSLYVDTDFQMGYDDDISKWD